MKGIRPDWSKWKRPSLKALIHAKAAGLYMICTLSSMRQRPKAMMMRLCWIGEAK